MTTQTFEELGLSSSTLNALTAKGFVNPTPIQSLVIPHLLDGEKDIIGKAKTGTGKTAAFGLPILDRLEENNEHVQALILAPTRELAMQVCTELTSLAGDKKVSIVPIYGGAAISTQIRQLKKIPNIVVGTPGRVIDHLERKTLNLKNIEYLILDEADEMLNFGFLDELKTILTHANTTRKTLFFSATMPSGILKLTKKYLKDHLVLEAKSDKGDTHANIEELFYEVTVVRRRESLYRVLETNKDFHGFLFCRTRREVDEVTAALQQNKFGAEGIHGNLSQSQRERILKKFRDRECNILVGTDVAARGLDVKGVTHVINYSLPQSPESYVHRIGRTGRGTDKGVAMTFTIPSERHKFKRMQRVLNRTIKKGEIPTTATMVAIRQKDLSEKLYAKLLTDEPLKFKSFSDNLIKDLDPVKAVSGLVALLLEESKRAPIEKEEKKSNKDRDFSGSKRGSSRGGRGGDRRSSGGRSRDRGGRGGDRRSSSSDDKPRRSYKRDGEGSGERRSYSRSKRDGDSSGEKRSYSRRPKRDGEGSDRKRSYKKRDSKPGNYSKRKRD